MKDTSEGPFPESRMAVLEGVRYHYRLFAPEGEPEGNILLIHGFASSTFSWRKLFAPLTAKGYRVIAVDIPPFGFSDRSPDISHSPLANAERLWELLEREGVERAHVVGHSMGARIAGAMGTIMPDRCRTVFLVDGPFFGTGGRAPLKRFAGSLLRAYPARWTFEELGRRMAKSRAIVRRALSFVYGERASERAVEGYMRPLSLKGTAYSLPPYFLERSAQAFDLEALRCRVHLIWGEKDRLFRPRMARRFLDEYPHEAELSLIEGGGHCPMETHPEAFLQAIFSGMER